MRRIDFTQSPALAVVAVGILREQRLTIGDMEPAFVEPDRDPLSGESSLGVQVKPLNADVPPKGNDALELHAADRPLRGRVGCLLSKYATYHVSRSKLKRALLAGMRQGKDHRGLESRGHYGRPRIADMLSIDERPDEVAERKIPGHWEGDLVIGKGAKSAMGTLVERTSRFTMLVPLPHGRSAESTCTAIAAKVTELPATLRRSLTWDQGTELADHKRFTVDTGVAVFFAHHRSPWERGTNENTNGLLRQYIPKGTVVPTDGETLDAVADRLNGRPRRTLGRKTPAEAFSQLLESPVASTG